MSASDHLSIHQSQICAAGTDTSEALRELKSHRILRVKIQGLDVGITDAAVNWGYLAKTGEALLGNLGPVSRYIHRLLESIRYAVPMFVVDAEIAYHPHSFNAPKDIEIMRTAPFCCCRYYCLVQLSDDSIANLVVESPFLFVEIYGALEVAPFWQLNGLLGTSKEEVA